MIRRLLILIAFSAIALPAQDLQQVFKIQPLHPIAELRAEALKAQPPAESGNFRQPDLVELVKIDPTIKLDIHYASTNNFLGTPVYTQARAFLQRPAAEALVRANRKLHEQGYGVLIFDGYRPWYVTKIFWDATPPEDHDYVADPSQGSRHNRGCAADLTLYDLKTGKPLDMPSGYDEMTERAHPDYAGGTPQQRANRELLRHAMEAEGFTVYTTEWWHFDYKDWAQYPIVNIPFEDLNATQSGGASSGSSSAIADKTHSEWSAAMHAKNLEGLVALYAPDGGDAVWSERARSDHFLRGGRGVACDHADRLLDAGTAGDARGPDDCAAARIASSGSPFGIIERNPQIGVSHSCFADGEEKANMIFSSHGDSILLRDDSRHRRRLTQR
jgi:zinc D-Ala-D-Ala dipeptidase